MSAFFKKTQKRLPFALLTLSLVASSIVLYAYLSAPLDETALFSFRSVPSSVILDHNGQRLYEVLDTHRGFHQVVPLAEIPLHLRQAVIATEDATFYTNPGFSPAAILRSLWLNLREGKIVSGASTITQQIARQALPPSERYQQTLLRKLHELWLAYRLTRSLSKDEILALYLNEAYFGNMSYGVDAAARTYFGKPVQEINLAEAAMLAGLLQAPSAYNPLLHPEAAKARQRTVLDLMVRAGYIDSQTADLAFREPLRYGSQAFEIRAPHFTFLVWEQVEALIDPNTLRQGGLTIRTTLDWNLQREAEIQVRRHLAKINQPTAEHPGHQVRNAAVVALAPDGAVRIMIGSPDYFDARIDGAVNAALALRQPGSALKPFTYAAAFERGMSPATVISDVPMVFQTAEGEPYEPVNYDGVFHGPVSLREALGSSYNVVAVRVLNEIGILALVDMAKRVGIHSLDHPERHGLALTLGGVEVTLFELTSAYATLAQGGRRVEPYLIEEIRDAHGHVLYKHTPSPPQQVLDPRIAYLVTDVLADPQARIPGFGYGSALELPFPAAVKTGTTNNWRDNWTVGYTTQWTVGVWVGNADGSPMEQASGVTGAAPIWNALMRLLHRTAPPPFQRPEGLVTIEVCADSGKLPGPGCLRRRQELFLPENAPQEMCDRHRLMIVDALTGQPATEDTPQERRITRVVTYWPADALAWAVEQGLPLPPDAPPLTYAQASPSPVHERGSQPYLVTPSPNGIYRIVEELPIQYQQIAVSAVCPTFAPGDRLELWTDGELEYVWERPPFTTFWPLVQGEHTFSLVQRKEGEIVISEPVRIRVLSETDPEKEVP